MKKLLLISTALFAATKLFAQSSIPNPSFENWTAQPYMNPTGYQSSNKNQGGNGPVTIGVFRVTSPYHANYAAQMKSVKSGIDTDAAYISNGDPGKGVGGSPITGTPTGARIYYTYKYSKRDTAILIFQFKKGGSVFASFQYQITDTTSTYMLFPQMFSPALAQTPDTILFAACSSIRVTEASNGGPGWDPTAVFTIDSLTLTGIATQPSGLNGDFENWVADTNVTLQNWSSNFGTDSGQYKRTMDAESGKYAVELTTGPCGGCGGGNTNPEGITTGKPQQMSGPTGGQPYTMPADSLDTIEFYYKYVPATTNPQDTADVSLQFHKGSSNNAYMNIFLTSSSVWKRVDFPIDFHKAAWWYGNWSPDSVMIGVQSSYCSSCMSGFPNKYLGSDLKVDNFSFKGQIDLSITPANPAFCSGSSVVINVSGATTYTWSPSTGLSATTGSSVTANPIFTQTYTVTGKTGTMTATQTVKVTVNPNPTITFSPTSPSICAGNSVNITASGATSSYVWSPSTGLSSTVLPTVTANPTSTKTYTVTGTNTTGCTGSNSVTVTVNATPTITVTPTTTICYGSSAVLTAGGGSTYTWSPSTGLSATTGATVSANPTSNTTYTVTGKNASGCTSTATVTVNVNSAITVSKTAYTDPSCNGSCNGSISMGVSGGTAPYTYSWNNAATTVSLTNVCAGNYTLTVTDGLGCTGTDTVKLLQPAAITVGMSHSNTTCGSNNGQATATPSGGKAPYTYLWNNGQTSAIASNLGSGSYTVTVTDKNGCTGTGTVSIAASSGPSITSITTKESNCGAKNGDATATVTGGASPYTYSWNNGQTTATADSLAAGVYILTVTDKNGCSTFKSVNISDTNGPSINVTSTTNENCNGDAIGALSISVSGGVTPYQYLWSNSATTSSISGLTAGPYQITVTDAFGCTDVKTLTITQPSAISLSTSTVQASCGISDGQASVTASGGTSPYNYSWSNAATTSNINGLAVGTYSVTVTDNHGCTASTQASVSNAAGPSVVVDTVVNNNCTSGTTGTIVISATGGTTPYTYLWNNGATTDTITGLVPGNYAVTVTDAGGCAGTTNATVTQSQPPAISICEVTVDPSNNFNNVEWNRTTTPRIASYNIYKETTSPGVYNKIGSVSAASSGPYVDSLSDARKRSWRYEISQVDSCGNESPLSLPHKTMHLTISSGAGNSVNLVWDNYEGLSFGYYIVYRDTVPGIASDSIDYVTNSGIYTYTDYPPLSTSVYYHMGIPNPGGCGSAFRVEAINYNSSKSNSGNIIIGPTNVQNTSYVNHLEIYPNPNTGMFNMVLGLSKQQNVGIKIYNALGQLVETNNYGALNGKIQKQIDMTGFSKGVYTLQIITDNGVLYHKVIIQ